MKSSLWDQAYAGLTMENIGRDLEEGIGLGTVVVQWLYDRLTAVAQLAQNASGSRLFDGGWKPHGIDSEEVCRIIGCDPPQPPPPPTEAELAEIGRWLDEVRRDLAAGSGGTTQ